MNTNEMKAAAESLKHLFNSFQTAGPVDVEAQSAAYLWAVKDYELPDLLQAVHRFIHGEVNGFDGAFCPSTAQLCQEIRSRREIRELLEKRAARGEVVALNPQSKFLQQWEQQRGQG